MSQNELAARYEDRLRRYCGLAEAPAACIELGCDAEFIETYTAQVALLTAASLLGRQFGKVRLVISDATEVHPKIPGKERLLKAALARELELARPQELREPESRDDGIRPLRIIYGATPCDVSFFGRGWTATVGEVEARQPDHQDENPFGAAMSAILAAGEAFRLANDAALVVHADTINLWNWNSEPAAGPAWRAGLDLGEIWVVGVGSVGSSALHFLCLSQMIFIPSLFDGDEFKLENISRSPVFSSADKEGDPKVEIVSRFLAERGITVRRSRPTWLHLSGDWEDRPVGLPDLLISTANEHHVRWHIEVAFPPVQLHASTGMNWQAAVFRHIPVIDPCSLCVFPDSGAAAQPVCATGQVIDPVSEVAVDASLPFLSYAAGLMIAVEAYKLAAGESQPTKRVYLQFGGGQRVLTVPLAAVNHCSCATRSSDIHLQAIRGSRYASLSGPL